MKKILVVFLFSILYTVLVGCNSKTANHNIGINDSVINSETICAIHEKNCGKIAKDMEMTIDEYHIWDENQQLAIEMEDEMTDENGDIVDSNSSYRSNTSSSIFNAFQCFSCGFVAKGTNEPGQRDFNGCGDDRGVHQWIKVNTNGLGEQCSRCGLIVYYSIGGSSSGEKALSDISALGLHCMGSNSGHYWKKF